MTVVINELEQLPQSGNASQPGARGGTGGDAPQGGSSPAQKPTPVMAMIRREVSRVARVWAD